MKLPRRVKTKVRMDRYTDNLQELGYKYFDSGSFASVYAKPGSKNVIKVGKIQYQDAYIAFLKSIDETNPHFPKVKSVQLFKNSGGDYYVVEMERLINFFDVKDTSSKLTRLGITNDRDYYGQLDSMQELEFTPRTKHMKQVKRVLRTLFNTHNEDLHAGNVMWRKRGQGYQFVITDPVA